MCSGPKVFGVFGQPQRHHAGSKIPVVCWAPNSGRVLFRLVPNFSRAVGRVGIFRCETMGVRFFLFQSVSFFFGLLSSSFGEI